MSDRHMSNLTTREFYRCPESFLDFALGGERSSDVGYFRFGANSICYGRSCFGNRKAQADLPLYDTLPDVVTRDGRVALPFDPTEIVDGLRCEIYARSRPSGCQSALKKIYYSLRPIMNESVRRQIQKFHARNWQGVSFPHWPVDTTVENIHETLLLLALQANKIDRIPFVWFWPEGARGCVAMTHDIETDAGREFCMDLLDIDDSYGIKASFLVVPEERYEISSRFLELVRKRGFEIGIQDLNHDGRLFENRVEFRRRAAIINRYGREYAAKGFRAAVLYRRPEWYEDLEFSFDMSMPNVAHLDPQRGGCCTVMPYFFGKLLELPVTTTQDYTLFHLLNQRSISLWQTQVELILAKNGLASFIVHPDYIIEPDTRSVYEELLTYLQQLREKMALWFALPHEIDFWWRARSKMSVVKASSGWQIEGEGAERATLAYARNVNGRLVYEQAETHVGGPPHGSGRLQS